MRLRLTDQALMAVRLARGLAAASTRPATAAHLLAGLAAEPDGRAGRRLRERATAAALLAERSADAGAPPLDGVLARAAARRTEHAATTVDLLDAAIAEGGQDVADLLAACGYDRDLDGYAAASPLGVWSDEAETYGLNPTDPDPYTAAAARAVAQTRARGGRAGDLLLAIAVAPEVGGTTLLDDVEVLALRLETLRGHGGGHGDDAPLDEVLPTAAEIASGPAITTADLVRAVLVAGGPTPRALLTGEAHGGAPSQRRTDQEQA